jgi:hypothetical protein
VCFLNTENINAFVGFSWTTTNLSLLFHRVSFNNRHKARLIHSIYDVVRIKRTTI